MEGMNCWSVGCLSALVSLFSCSSVGGISVGHDNKSWDVCPPKFFHAFFDFAVDPRDQMSRIKGRVTQLLFGDIFGEGREEEFVLFEMRVKLTHSG